MQTRMQIRATFCTDILDLDAKLVMETFLLMVAFFNGNSNVVNSVVTPLESVRHTNLGIQPNQELQFCLYKFPPNF